MLLLVRLCSLLYIGDIDDEASFPTEAHVRWAMESIGHAFTLPIDDAPVILAALKIYTKWYITHPFIHPSILTYISTHQYLSFSMYQ
jgi:hypothetical protein